MGFLDKLLGRGKKAAGDVTGDSSLRAEGEHQEQYAAATERAERYEGLAQEERTEAAHEHAQQEDQASTPPPSSPPPPPSSTP
jgi:uncharacterized protein YjbJ (UPF0337 family)